MRPFASGALGLLLCSLCVLARAEVSSPPTGTVEGRVVTGNHSPVPGVRVELRQGWTTLALGALSAADGSFRIEQVPAPGAYRLRCSLGERVQDGPEVLLAHAGAVATAEIGLRVAFFEEVTVTDLREEQSRRDTPATVTTLARETVARLNPGHPGELLAQVPGVWVNVTSGEGHAAAIRQPLTTSPVYLYLEDGVPTRSTGFFNHNALYEVNVPMAGGLEVTKGPGSALYGSDAIGGVVNVLTRSSFDAPGLGASVEGGGGGWGRLMLDGARAGSRHGLRGQLNLTHAEGWREATGYDRGSGTLRWDHALGEHTSIKTVATLSRIDQETAGSSVLAEEDYLERPTRNLTPISYRRVTALRLSTELTRVAGPTLLSATPYFRYDTMDLLPNWTLTFDPTYYDTRNSSWGLLLRGRRDLPRWRAQIVTGVDVDLSPGGHVETQIRPATERTADARTIFTAYDEVARVYDYDATFLSVSPYLHAEASPWARLRLSAGLRFDHMAYDYDDTMTSPPSPRHQRPADARRSYGHLSPKLGAALRVTDDVDVFAAYRHAFRAPSSGQLFRQGTARGTIDLRPVQADNLEAGIRLRPSARVSLEASFYRLGKRDDILSFRDPLDGATEAANAGRTRHQGLEVGLTARPMSWLELSAGWSRARHTYVDWVVDARNADFSGQEMETAPRDLGQALVTLRGPRNSHLSAEVVHLGRYWMDAANTQSYAGHTLVHLRGGVEVRRGVRLFARLLNVGDVRYAESATFTMSRGRELAPGAPRTVFAGVRVGR